MPLIKMRQTSADHGNIVEFTRCKMGGFRLHANTGVAGNGQRRVRAYQTEFKRYFLSGLLNTGRRT